MPDEDKHHVKNDHVVTGGGGLKDKKQFSWVKMSMLAVVVAVVGGFFVYSSFAASANSAAVTSAYQRLLGRAPDSGGLTYWTAQLDSGKKSISDVEDMIKGSAEYKNKQAATSAAPATATKPASGTKTNSSTTTSATPAASTPASAAASCTAKTAENTAFIKGLYTKYLKYAPDDAGLKYWVDQLDTCAKTSATAEAFFKAKSTVTTTDGKKPTAAGVNAAEGTPGADNPFPQRKDGETDRQYERRIDAWLVVEFQIMTQSCCGGLASGTGKGMVNWAELIRTGKWSPQQVLDHLKTQSGQSLKQMAIEANPDSKEAIDQNIKQTLGSAIMEQVTESDIKDIDYCHKTKELLDKGLLKGGLPYYCIYNSGYGFDNGGETERGKTLADSLMGVSSGTWTAAIQNGKMTLEEAVERVKKGETTASCEDVAVMASLFPSCGAGGQNVTQADLQAVAQQCYGGNLVTGTPSKDCFPNQPSQPTNGSNKNTGGTSQAPSKDAVNSNIPNDAAVASATNNSQTPLQKASSKAKSVTGVDKAVKACDSTTCAVLPLGTAKTSDIKSDATVPAAPIYENNYPTVSPYTESWDNGGSVNAASTTIGATVTNESSTMVAASDVAMCVDQYVPLKQGDKSVCVKVLRLYLGLVGYLNEETAQDGANVSGYNGLMIFGEGLKNAVAKYQKDRGMSNKSGSVDKATWLDLKDFASHEYQSQKQVASDIQVAAAVGDELQQQEFARLFDKCKNSVVLDKSDGMDAGERECVKRLQQILAFVQDATLSITGQFDAATQNAVTRFKAMRGLRGTPVVDKQTWELLEAAKQVSPYQSPYQAGSGNLASAY